MLKMTQSFRILLKPLQILILHNNFKSKQAEAEVVPSSSSVKFKFLSLVKVK